MQPLTEQDRKDNKALRLKHAADPADGLTVRFLTSGRHGERGVIAIVSREQALKLIKHESAELAE